MTQNLKVAVYQSRAQADRPPEARLGDLDRVLSDSATKADIVVCPELYLSGYRAGERHHALAEPLEGPFAKSVAALARKHDCCIVYGYPEAADGLVYNSSAAIGRDGAILANHRKTLLPNAYEQKWFSPGDHYTSFSIGDWKIALIVCYEVEFPEILRHSAQQGADLVVVPTALTENWGIVAHTVVPTRAFENGVYLAYANHSGIEHDLTYLGASCIVNPHGQVLARAGASEELIHAELDKVSRDAAREVLPYLTDCKRASELRPCA